MANRLQLENIPLLGSRGLPSLGSWGAPIPEEGSNTHSLRDPLDRKNRRRKAKLLLMKVLEKLTNMEKKA